MLTTLKGDPHKVRRSDSHGLEKTEAMKPLIFVTLLILHSHVELSLGTMTCAADCQCEKKNEGTLPEGNLDMMINWRWGTCSTPSPSCDPKEGAKLKVALNDRCVLEGTTETGFRCDKKTELLSLNCHNTSRSLPYDPEGKMGLCEGISHHTLSIERCELKIDGSTRYCSPINGSARETHSLDYCVSNSRFSYPGQAGWKLVKNCTLVTGDLGSVCAGECNLRRFVPDPNHRRCVEASTIPADIAKDLPQFECEGSSTKTSSSVGETEATEGDTQADPNAESVTRSDSYVDIVTQTDSFDPTVYCNDIECLYPPGVPYSY